MNLDETLKNSKKASMDLAALNNKTRNQILQNIKNSLLNNTEYILTENAKDIDNAKENGMTNSMIDRLTLNKQRLNQIADGVENVSTLDEVVNIELEQYTRPNGLKIIKKSVPFGVIAMIFESRPNVCVDIASLCIKTANACVLKGGKEAINSNKALVKTMREAIHDIVDENIITLIEDNSREITNELITKKEYIDLLVPRGGKNLINFVKDNAKVPIIETGAGNCHLYIHEKANLDMALKVAINAKFSRPSVCNAIENIVIDEKIARTFLPILKDAFDKLSIEIRGDKKVCTIINCNIANDDDFFTEYNDYIIAIKIVNDLNEAISFINEHSTKHSEAIITEDESTCNKFIQNIDSACVYHNASTRFSDGGEFGFGAELGISTQKMHARGPMGIKEMTSYKYIIYGTGQIRE